MFFFLFSSAFLIWVWIIFLFGVFVTVGGGAEVVLFMGVLWCEFWLGSGGSV